MLFVKRSLILPLVLMFGLHVDSAEAATYGLSNCESDYFPTPALITPSLKLISQLETLPPNDGIESDFSKLRTSTFQRLAKLKTIAVWSKTRIGCTEHTSPFGWRGWRFSRESSFPLLSAISRGAAIYSSGKGMVKYSGWSGGNGRIVLVEYFSGFQMMYLRLARSSVRTGQILDLGDEIGEATFEFGTLRQYNPQLEGI